jgi:hypothetical protein
MQNLKRKKNAVTTATFICSHPPFIGGGWVAGMAIAVMGKVVVAWASSLPMKKARVILIT